MNNKGYVLVEIVMAFAITFALVYFTMNLVINLKNKNDDLLVATLVATDQAIIYNAIMRDLSSLENVDCDYINDMINIDKETNTFSYGDFTTFVSDYATIGDMSCNNNGDNIQLMIPIAVKQLPDENFNVVVGENNYTDYVEDSNCVLSIKDEMITFTYSGDLSELSYYGWDSNFLDGNGNMKTEIDEGIHTYYIKNVFGIKSFCSIDVEKTIETKKCNSTKIRDASSGKICNAYNGVYVCTYSETKDRCECKYSGFENGMGGFYCCPSNGTYPSGAIVSTFSGPSMSYSISDKREGCFMAFDSSFVSTSYSCSTDEYTRYDSDWCYK